MKSSPCQVYTTHDREHADDYKCLFGYPYLESVMEDDNDQDEYDRWDGKKTSFHNKARPSRLNEAYYPCATTIM